MLSVHMFYSCFRFLSSKFSPETLVLLNSENVWNPEAELPISPENIIIMMLLINRNFHGVDDDEVCRMVLRSKIYCNLAADWTVL